MNPKVNSGTPVRSLEGIFEAIEGRAPDERGQLLKAFTKPLLSRAPGDFFRDRTEDELVELVCSTFELLEATPPDEIAVRVTQDEENPHAAAAEIVIGDRPFVVDTLRQYLTSRDYEIRAELHPVVVVERDSEGRVVDIRDWTAQGQRVAVAYCEFEGHLDPGRVRTMEDEIRACMEEVRLATDDFDAMVDQLHEVADSLAEVGERFPEREDEISEIIDFFEWLEADGFVFLGYRGYDFLDLEDDRRAVAVERGSGLGILRNERNSQFWEPKAIDELPAQLQARALFGPLLLVSKANSEARVHRRARMDYIGIKKLNASAEVVGEHRFLGLFTWKAYTDDAGDTPILREKLKAVLEAENVPKGSHDYKAIVAIFNSMPKEELFLVSLEDLRRQIAAIMAAEDTGEVRLVLTPDVLGRGVNVMVILPERNYSDEVRGRLRNELAERIGGTVLNDHLALGEGETARLHFYISASPDRVEGLDVERLERHVAGIVRTWKQRLRGALEDRHRAAEAHRLAETYLDAFTAEYVATVDVDTAIHDIERLESLEHSGLAQVSIEPYREGGVEASLLRLFVKRGSMILADVMPTLEHMGLRVIEADATEVARPEAGASTIHSFVVQGPDQRPLSAGEGGVLLKEALLAVRAGLATDDRLNELTVSAGLRWREVAVLRAYSGYAFQIGAVSSRRAVMDALTAHPRVSRLLFQVFRVKFDPEFEADRDEALEVARTGFLDSLQDVGSIGEDLTFRRLHNLIEATVRTSYYQSRAQSRQVPILSLKLRCGGIQQMPDPRPDREIYVHGVRTEGSHLRFGPVARGGIRWSDRRDDFRTEVLGLVKTQQVKNAVIVPVGAKGTYVVKEVPGERGQLKQAVMDSYRDFIRGLLDVTDNIVDGEVVRPDETVTYDEDDPYLVVAADKGTAAFSDTANEIAAEFDFWMGDAFASGGSHGYDHKKVGITARGTWECVRRHFREMEKDLDTEPVTVVGIGDMSGDVFGNGMLLSRQIKLLAAFDHRHIFIDPDPDPDTSYRERARLFEMSTSSWADYDESLISEGGGVYERGAKEIHLSGAAREVLNLAEDVVNGQRLIRAILQMPGELLWNGGIGTYVKASWESHAGVGDSSNDAVRVDADDVQVKVVGEGGNLGFTQPARIEYALAGGRIDTDAVDNSAGVDLSDHEVNLKILLGSLVDRGELTLEERNELLGGITDEVSEDVLDNNQAQARALSLEQLRSAERLSEFRDAIYFLERQAGLDRSLEHLPGWETLQERQENGKGLTRPELGVLLGYSKMHIKREILNSAIPDDPALTALLKAYFPDAVVDRVTDEDLRGHWLQRQIVATVLTNRIADLMGCTFVPRVCRDTGASPAEVARGWHVAAEIAGAIELVGEIHRNEGHFPVDQEYEWLLALETVLDRTVRWAVENLPEDEGIGGVIELFKSPVARLCEVLPSIVVGSQRAAFEEALEGLKAGGVRHQVAQKLAALRFLEELMEVTRISREVGEDVADVGRVYFALADEVDFAWLIELLDMAPGEDEWEQRAAQGLMQDLGQARRNLTLGVLSSGDVSAGIDDRLQSFRARQADRLGAMRAILQEVLVAENINLAALTVATRDILRESQAALDGRFRPRHD